VSKAFITNPVGILAILSGVAAFFFFLEKQTRWKLFNYFPPLLFIYAVPLIFSNTGVIAGKSEVYGWMGDVILPLFLTIMLLDVDVRRAFKTMGGQICGRAVEPRRSESGLYRLAADNARLEKPCKMVSQIHQGK